MPFNPMIHKGYYKLNILKEERDCVVEIISRCKNHADFSVEAWGHRLRLINELIAEAELQVHQ